MHAHLPFRPAFLPELHAHTLTSDGTDVGSTEQDALGQSCHEKLHCCVTESSRPILRPDDT